MKKAAVTIDWSELPVDLLVLIVRRLDHFPNDHARFSAVCKSWRLVAIPNRCHIHYKQLPVGLMVPGIYVNSRTRRCFLLNQQSGFFEEEEEEEEDQYANSNKQLDVPHGCVCHGSAYGWLFLVDDELNTKLLNPFTSAEIQLPSVATLPPPKKSYDDRDKWYVFKAVFSSNPSCFQQPPVILIIYGGGNPRLAFCKPGDEAWTALEHLRNRNYYFLDAIYYKDRFLALGADGEIMALEIGTSIDGHCEVKVTQYAWIPGIHYLEPMFLVEVQGDLVALTRKERYGDKDDSEDDNNYEGKDYRGVFCYGAVRTTGFTMLRFGTNEKKWVEVKSLGDNVLFLGYNTSFSLPMASEYLGCIPNSIYFTNGTGGGGSACDKYGYDMGIYNLMDKSIKPLYPIGSQLMIPSSIWITRVLGVCRKFS